MKLIVGISGGKGGTGKSFVATSLAALLAKRYSVVLADLDVEAPNDHILLGLSRLGEGEPIEVFFPFIDYAKCTSCGACAKVCDTGAIVMSRGKPPFIMPRLCSGCKACYYVCPYNAIVPGGRIVGYIHVNKLRGLTLVTGIIREGEEHTPPAIVAAKKRAIEEASSADILFIDTGAGTGNSISAALQGAELLIAVTEPTPLGLHDLQGILEIARGMDMRIWVVVNRAGIGPDNEHVALAGKYGAEKVYRIPFSKNVAKAYAEGRLVVEAYPDDPASKALLEIASAIEGQLKR